MNKKKTKSYQQVTLFYNFAVILINSVYFFYYKKTFERNIVSRFKSVKLKQTPHCVINNRYLLIQLVQGYFKIT